MIVVGDSRGSIDVADYISNLEFRIEVLSEYSLFFSCIAGQGKALPSDIISITSP